MERAGHDLERERILHNCWRKYQLEHEISEQTRTLISYISQKSEKYIIQQDLDKSYCQEFLCTYHQCGQTSGCFKPGSKPDRFSISHRYCPLAIVAERKGSFNVFTMRKTSVNRRARLEQESIALAAAATDYKSSPSSLGA